MVCKLVITIITVRPSKVSTGHRRFKRAEKFKDRRRVSRSKAKENLKKEKDND